MLQQRQVSKLLKKALDPLPSTTLPPTTSFRAISISLLSKHGNPLISITSHSRSSSSTPDSDQLRIYSLLAYNTTLSSDEEWNTVDFQGTKCIISRLVLNNHVDETSPSDKQGINITGESEGSNVESLIKTGKEEDEVVSEPIVFYVVLFYDTGGESENKQDEDENGDSNHEVKEGKDKYLADAIAKVKVDCIVDALREGLNGYGEKH